MTWFLNWRHQFLTCNVNRGAAEHCVGHVGGFGSPPDTAGRTAAQSSGLAENGQEVPAPPGHTAGTSLLLKCQKYQVFSFILLKKEKRAG